MKRTPLRKISKKRQRELPRMRRLRNAAFYRDDYRCCFAGILPDCQGMADDPHHIWPVGSHSEWRYVLENVVSTCRICHAKVQDDPSLLELVGIDRATLKEEFIRGIGTIID